MSRLLIVLITGVIVFDIPKLAIDILKAQASYRDQTNERYIRWTLMNDESLWSEFYNLLTIEALCPGRVRVGGVEDGGKWLCAPWKVPTNCTIFSVGLMNDVKFEKDLFEKFGLKCGLLGIDQIEQGYLTRSTYQKLGGEVVTGVVVSKQEKGQESPSNQFVLENIVKSHGWKNIDILKIDLEAVEYNVLPEFLAIYKPCQLLIETHYGIRPTVGFLGKISVFDYWLYSFEVNDGAFNACEYSFIHQSCLEHYGAYGLARFLS
ncbi:unnamed protein product, partial [Mesorhabditis belari]|uniref:Methyltransferase domain-containing protein n=1 Tax=Mesorhabditis belari TaxID=2138241 RepID=A0AAF3FJI4_9BILA